ncbi:MAG TPA: aminotransferase class IV [Arenibacter sp.]|nr:aminotransferase class IV [Arenibacter sp.]
MIDFNGDLLPKTTFFLNHENRGLRYGDSLFETIRVVNGKIFFWEDHYLRLMASMRILRMEIPMDFTMEYLEERIGAVITGNMLETGPARVRFTVFRKNGGRYLPATNDVSFIIEAEALEALFFVLDKEPYEVELFKDFYINPDMLATLKTNNRLINVVGSVYADENGYRNCLLLNNEKKVVEALNGNLFLVNGNIVKTPPLKDGCINGIIRKRLISILKALDQYVFEEDHISPFELQKADELFLTNAVVGIQPISRYRKKEYATTVATDLVGKLNASARLN